MKFISIIFLLAFLPCRAQMISSPVFRESVISFETAKISQYNTKTKKYLPESFKSCSLIIENANTSTPTFTIDMPDIYYCKNVDAYSIKYEKEQSSESVTYMINDGKYIAAITLIWVADYSTVSTVNVTFSSLGESPQVKSYRLYEFK